MSVTSQEQQRSEIVAGATMGGLLGALGITTVVALVAAAVALGGGFRPAPVAETLSATAAMPANMPGMAMLPAAGAATTGQTALGPAKTVTVKSIARAASDL